MLCKNYRYRFQTYLTSKDIRDVHKILYILSKLFLICPYTIHNDYVFVVTKIDILIIILQTTLFCSLSYALFNGFPYFFLHNDTKIDLLTDTVQIFGIYLVYFSSFAHMHYYRKQITKLLINATKYNALTKKIVWEIDYKQQIQRTLLLIIYLMTIELTSAIFSIILQRNIVPAYLIIYFYLGHCYYNVIYCYSNLFFYDVQKHFDHLQTNLKFLSISPNINIATLKITLDVYRKIVTQCEKINYTFYFPLLLEMSNTFFCIIATIFNITFLIIERKELEIIIFTIFLAINWNMPNLSKILLFFGTMKSILNKVHHLFNCEYMQSEC